MSYTAASLEFLPSGTKSIASGVNSNGTVVVGYAVNSSAVQLPVYWDSGGTIHLLPTLNSGGNGTSDQALGCSEDGTVIVGVSDPGTEGAVKAVVWTGGPSWTITALAGLPGGDGTGGAYCCVSSELIFGTSFDGTADAPVAWISGVISALPTKVGFVFGQANACSSDGSTVVGCVTTDIGTSGYVAVWSGGPPAWTLSTLSTPSSETDPLPQATACSSDGSVVAGFGWSGFTSVGCYWDPGLNELASPSNVLGCSGSGAVLVGNGVNPPAYVYVSGTGSELPNLAGATSTTAVANAISTDASTIVGLGTNSAGQEVAIKWSAVITSHIATVADLFFSPTSSFVDFTQVANRRKFISVNGGAQNLNPDGSAPFAVSPPVFLSVQGADTPTDFAANQGRGGAFLQSGPAPTDGASDPPPVTVSTQSAASTTPFSAVLGDYLTGNIYAFSTTALTDNGQQRKWVRRWRALPGDTTSAVTFSYLALNMKSGIGVPPGTNPQLVLRWSDDGGKTWSGNRIIPVGVTGATTFTVKFNRLGSTQRFSGSTRIFELSSTDQFKVNIISAEVLVK